MSFSGFFKLPKKSLFPNWILGLLVSSPFHLLGAGFSYKKKIKIVRNQHSCTSLLGLLSKFGGGFGFFLGTYIPVC
jgi:hypothetical protein